MIYQNGLKLEERTDDGMNAPEIEPPSGIKNVILMVLLNHLSTYFTINLKIR